MRKDIVKTGTIDISQLNNPPDKDELATAKYFAAQGKDIVFIRPSNIKGNFRPDFTMDGNEWEVKNPVGNGKSTINRNLHHAIEQSDHIIFDLRHYRGNEDDCIAKLQKEFRLRHNIRELLIIRRNGEMIVLSKQP